MEIPVLQMMSVNSGVTMPHSYATIMSVCQRVVMWIQIVMPSVERVMEPVLMEPASVSNTVVGHCVHPVTPIVIVHQASPVMNLQIYSINRNIRPALIPVPVLDNQILLDCVIPPTALIPQIRHGKNA